MVFQNNWCPLNVVRVLDHIVIGKGRYVSFVEDGATGNPEVKPSRNRPTPQGWPFMFPSRKPARFHRETRVAHGFPPK
jgi:hypothetical protein